MRGAGSRFDAEAHAERRQFELRCPVERFQTRGCRSSADEKAKPFSGTAKRVYRFA
jgi:hypothetical protein